jgi:hypothetical protein
MKITGTSPRPASSFSRRGLETVDPRHHGVEQHDVGRDLFDDPHRRGAVERDHHRHAGAVERVGQHPQRLGRVVDDQRDVAFSELSVHDHKAFAGSSCIG